MRNSFRSKRASYYNATQRAKHIALGLCRDCNDKAEPGRKSCRRHLDWSIRRKREWRRRIKEILSVPEPEPEVHAYDSIPCFDNEVPF